MGSHINADGEFQSDKYPTCPAGKVPLSVEDGSAQDLLWEYAQRRREVDAEFSDDLEQALRAQGYVPKELPIHLVAEAAGVGDADTVGAIVHRVEALYKGVYGSHRVVLASEESGDDTCGDCGADIEDALSDGLVCPGKPV